MIRPSCRAATQEPPYPHVVAGKRKRSTHKGGQEREYPGDDASPAADMDRIYPSADPGVPVRIPIER